MKEILELILESIIDADTSEFTITKIENEDGVTFELSLPDDFKGKLIGKSGRNIKAIRDILSIIARREDRRVQIKVLD